MKINNIHIENFRNIVRADANFGPINIFTGRNSSGKSNFLLALSRSMKIDRDFSEFGDNVVTFGPGKNKAVIKTKVDDISRININTEKNLETNIDTDYYFQQKGFCFENAIGKKSSSIGHKLFFTGSYSEQSSPKDRTSINKNIEAYLASFKTASALKEYSDELVYSNDFIEEVLDGNTQIKIEKNISNTQSKDKKFFDLFSQFKESIVSYADPKKFSSTAIHEFVTEKYETDVYEQALNRLKELDDLKKYSITTPFRKSKFIFLLADVQRDEKQRTQFKKDLSVYTKNVIQNVFINTDGSLGGKGEIWIESVNAPKDIFYISGGTAVLVFFILLKNWLQIDSRSVSYQKPEVMVFDEVDSIIHPSLMVEFEEILRAVSKRIQLFISTHSPHFIDRFGKDEIFWLKDFISEQRLPGNNSSLYSYKAIIDSLPGDKDYFLGRRNSELFVDGLLDSIFPNHE